MPLPLTLILAVALLILLMAGPATAHDRGWSGRDWVLRELWRPRPAPPPIIYAQPPVVVVPAPPPIMVPRRQPPLAGQEQGSSDCNSSGH